MKRQLHNKTAFTLIELLVVISIIGILAAMVVGIAGIALRKSKIMRVQTELVQLKTAIEGYKARKGFYPPDNPKNSQTNGLYYELVGTTRTGVDYATLDQQEKLQMTSAVTNALGVRGFANASAGKGDDNSAGAEAFLKELKESQLNTITVGGQELKLFRVPVEGGDPDKTFNPWHYVSTNPTNNPDGYDLWAEILIRGRTNIIGNWSDQIITR